MLRVHQSRRISRSSLRWAGYIWDRGLRPAEQLKLCAECYISTQRARFTWLSLPQFDKVEIAARILDRVVLDGAAHGGAAANMEVS